MMNRIEKIAFLVLSLGSILYFLLQELKEKGIALDGGMSVILTLIMGSIALFCWGYLRSQDAKEKKNPASDMEYK
jgi:hypothetical protein